MLKRLQVHNFKSWRSIGPEPMEFGSITGLFGTNSSGKTSILQSLLLMKQTADSPDRERALSLGDPRSPINLGSFAEMVHDHDIGRPFRIALDWRLPGPLRVSDPTRQQPAALSSRDLGFATEVREEGRRMVVCRLEYRFAGHCFGMDLKAGNGTAEGSYELFAEPGDFQFSRRRGRPRKLPSPVKCYGFPDEVRANYQNAGFLADFELAFERFFGAVYYLGPLRETPQRQYVWSGGQPVDVGQRGERWVDALLASKERGQLISPGPRKHRITLEERVARHLRDLGLISSFAVRPVGEGSNLYQVWVRQSPLSSEVKITDVGFGVSQVLPVLVLCYYVPKGALILLEQPELHLHPSVQAGLADVLIDAVRTHEVQILVESHSEHLLKRLQRRIAEEQIAPSEVALYFCDLQEGRSRLHPLQIDMFGSIQNWPPDFFGDPMQDIAATMRAETLRKMRASG